MSKVQLQGNALGTGTFTIASPNSNTDRTLTLPDNTGTLLSTGSNSNFPAGSVLQVVQTTFSSSTSTASSTFVSSGHSATITPKSATSKILVMLNGGGQYGASGSVRNLQTTIYRGATNLGGSTENSFSRLYATNTEIAVPHSLCYLDSPATTNATTYTIYFKASAQANQVYYYVGTDSGVIALTLMEIAA